MIETELVSEEDAKGYWENVPPIWQVQWVVPFLLGFFVSRSAGSVEPTSPSGSWVVVTAKKGAAFVSIQHSSLPTAPPPPS